MHLPIPPDYRFALLLDILARFAHPSLYVVRDAALWRVVRHAANDALALVRITAHPDNNYLVADVVAHSPDYPLNDPATTAERERQLTHILGLQDDLSAFYGRSQADLHLKPLIAPLMGLPLWRSETVYEALMYVIIEQHIAWTNAQRAQRWLVEWGEQVLYHDEQAYFAMPTSHQLATATVDDLRPLKITFKRMALLIDIAAQIASGQRDLEALQTMPSQTAYDELMQIKGVGHWTAAVVLSRARGLYDYVAHNDVALQAAVNWYFYAREGRATADTVKATFAQYGNHAGLAAHFTLMRWVLDRYPRLPT